MSRATCPSCKKMFEFDAIDGITELSCPYCSQIVALKKKSSNTWVIVSVVLGIGCLGVVMVGALLAAILAPAIMRAREAAVRVSCTK